MSVVINGSSGVNLDYSTGGRITGDFSNATLANRVMFQTSTANANTNVSAIPNGTGSVTNIYAFNSSDPSNSSYAVLSAIASTDVRISSSQLGTGTYLPMTFYTGGSERMRIDSSGNVGIGTSSPLNRLHVANTTTTGTASDNVDLTVSSFNRNASVNIDAAAANSGNLVFKNAGTEKGRILYANTTNYMAFQVNGTTEAMRIDSSGNLLVGIPSASNSSNTFYRASGVIQTNYSGSTAGQLQIVFANPNGNVGSIATAGTTTAYNTSSDYRLKDNIQPMSGALAKVAALKPCIYKWKVDGSDGEGFIAHELAEVVPQCVTGEKDAVDSDGNPKYQGIDTSFLVATLTAAIQELNAKVDAQAAEIAALKGQA